MNKKLFVCATVFTIVFFTACKKDSDSECSAKSPNERIIVDKQATVKLVNGKYYIYEDGAYDTRLIPCSLSQDFKANDRRVLISGEVKKTTPRSGEPCCTNFVVLTKII